MKGTKRSHVLRDDTSSPSLLTTSAGTCCLKPLPHLLRDSSELGKVEAVEGGHAAVHAVDGVVVVFPRRPTHAPTPAQVQVRQPQRHAAV